MQIALDLFVCFVAVAEEMSFRKAAEKLSKDQSWLSRRIRKLEEYLGVRLFERNTRHVSLTADGRALLEQAQGFADMAERLQGFAREMRHSQVRRLRIGAAAYSAYMTERVELVNKFMLRHPNDSIEVIYGQTFNLIERLHRRDIDVAFVSMPFDRTGLDGMLFHSAEGGVWMRHDDPLAYSDVVTAEQISGRRVANLPRNVKSKLQEMIHKELTAAGAVLVSMPETERSAIRLYAQKQQLLLFTFDGADDLSKPSDSMVYRPLSGLDLRRDMWLVRNTDNQSAIADWFWAQAQKQVKPAAAKEQRKQH